VSDGGLSAPHRSTGLTRRSLCAGACRDRNGSASWITFAVIWKYLLVAMLRPEKF